MVPTFLWAYLLATLAVLCAHAAPTPAFTQLDARQQNAPFNGPRTVQTRNVTNVAGGSIVQDCTITFTPIVVNGDNLVREESTCSEIFVPTGHQLPPPPPPNTTLPPSSTTTTVPPPPDTTTTTTDTPPPPPATTNTPPPPSTTDTPPPTPPPASTDTNTPPADTNTASPDPGTAQQPSNTEPVLGPTTPPPGVAEGQNSPTGSSASSTATDGVNIPGKELQVLPIGLGVFAGISVIALIVVGLVTYERTKYRKAFRQRRLAASGAEMGYGGMSERR